MVSIRNGGAAAARGGLRRALLLAALAVCGAGPARAEEGPAPAVVVRGDRSMRPSPRDPTAASTVVSGEALREPGAGSAEILERVPGVEVNRTGARSDLSTASLRGATSAQTPVYLAGVRLNDEVTGTADLSTVPLWMLDRVEIFRGNAPEHADRFGMGGAVFFEPRWPRGPGAAAGTAVGSFGERSVWAGGAVGSRRSSALVALRRDAATNDYPYVDDGGTRFDLEAGASDDREVRRQNADFESHDLWAVGRHELGGGARLTTVLHGFRREQGIPGLGTVPALGARATTDRRLGAVTASLPCAGRDDAGACRLELSTSVVSAHLGVRDSLRELSSDAPEVSNGALRVTQEAGLVREVSDRVRLSGRVSHAVEHLAIARTGIDGLRARRTTERASASALVAVTRHLDLHGLGALECHGTTGPAGADLCGIFAATGRLGLRVHASGGVQLLANAGRYVRVPTLGELFGISPLVRGNTDLVAERGRTADAGARFKLLEAGGGSALHLEAVGFVREASELVAFRRASAFAGIRPFNIGAARILGVETGAVGTFRDALRTELAVTMMDPRDVTPSRRVTNDLLPFHARLVLSGTTQLHSARLPAWLGGGRAFVGVRVTHRASRFADPAGLVVVPGATLWDLDGGVRLLGEALALRVALRNLFDARRFDVVGLPLPGRTAHASLEVETW